MGPRSIAASQKPHTNTQLIQAKRYTNQDAEKRRTYVRDGRSPVPKKEATSRIMSANRGKGTVPERKLAERLLTLQVGRFITNPKEIPGRPDVYFPKQMVAIFVNGCFWHNCPFCKPSLPSSHRAFWRKKFITNKERDRKQRRILKDRAIKSLVIWECQMKKDMSRQVMRILKALGASN